MTRIPTVLLAATLTAAAQAQTTVSKAPYGNLPDGATADLYTLQDKTLTIRITTWGAHITEIIAPDSNGAGADVILGHSSLDEYIADTKTYMGSVVGRYGNRIAGAKFTLDGHTYDLSKNEPTDTLHGGKVGYDHKNWTRPADPQRGRDDHRLPRRRHGLPRRGHRPRPLHPGRRQTPRRLLRHHRPAHRHQPHQPRLLQHGRQRRYALADPLPARLPLHPRRPESHSHRRARPRRRHPL